MISCYTPFILQFDASIFIHKLAPSSSSILPFSSITIGLSVFPSPFRSCGRIYIIRDCGRLAGGAIMYGGVIHRTIASNQHARPLIRFIESGLRPRSRHFYSVCRKSGKRHGLFRGSRVDGGGRSVYTGVYDCGRTRSQVLGIRGGIVRRQEMSDRDIVCVRHLRQIKILVLILYAVFYYPDVLGEAVRNHAEWA